MIIRFEVGKRYNGISDSILVLDRVGSTLKIQMPNGHISEVEIKEHLTLGTSDYSEYVTRSCYCYFARQVVEPTKKSLMVKMRLIKASIAETTDKKELKRLQDLLEETRQEFQAVFYTYVD